MSSSYSTDVEGGRPIQVRFAILGRLDASRFLAFVAERAAWLDLSGWAEVTAGGVTVVAAGPEALVGALEMACTLGPFDALVESITGADEAGVVPMGFALR